MHGGNTIFCIFVSPGNRLPLNTPSMRKDLIPFRDLLTQAPQTIVLFAHPRPDVDSFSSVLALGMLFRKRGHHVTLISPTDYPRFFQFLPGAEEVLVYPQQSAVTEAALSSASVIGFVDFGSAQRLLELASAVVDHAALRLVVDHHLDEPEGDIVVWNPCAVATAQLVYELIMACDPAVLDAELATCLYAGLLTDTCSFTTPSVTASTYQLAAALLTAGAVPSEISHHLNHHSSLQRMRFVGHVLQRRLFTLPKQEAAYIAIPCEDFIRFRVQAGDTEGLVHYALELQGVRCAVLLTEQQNGVRLSFRSVGDLPVNHWAKSHFNGGGHKNAAGGFYPKPLAETVTYLTSVITREMASCTNRS